MMSIVFFGSGPVAAQSLQLLAQTFDIEAVITKPRPPHHKGTVPVLDVAESLNAPVITARNKRELSDAISTQTFSSKVAVLIDFGIIVTQDVIDAFPLGIVNSHFSLLPEWRGADPITFSILSGQKQTGVSLMLLVEAMDEGPILAQGEYDLPDDITTPLLTDGLIQLSQSLLENTLEAYVDGSIQPISQTQAATLLDHSTEPTYSRKLSKEDGIIDWTKPAATIEREIRAYMDWPKSRTTLGTVDVVITSALAVNQQIGKAGDIHVNNKSLHVACGNGYLDIVTLKPAGKNEMSAESFLAGYRSMLEY